jgi:protein-S-isoprenylcysteine O-methyltransferase Ste14
MLTTLRHFLSILLLPFMVVIVVPWWLLNAFAASDSRWDAVSPLIWFPRLAGLACILVGFALLCWCIGLFARVGQGTLAPWDPTRKLVTVGPYRFVRNPMISGVVLLLIGQALFWGSWIVGLWACIFICINHTYFVLLEEPGLGKRFGESYRRYKANVPRWLPRVKPWAGE